MAYINKADYLYQMRTYRLDQIVEGDDTILDLAEIDAQALISFYLSNYYNMVAEFATSGAARNAIVVRWAKVLVIYYIYERIPDESVPERVVKNYDDVIKMLEMINGADKNVPGLSLKTEVNEDGETEVVTRRRWGSRSRRSNDPSSNTLNRY